MSKITTLHRGKKWQKRVNVSLDGKSAFGLDIELAKKEGLQIGQELSPNQIEKLVKSDRFHRCYNAAVRYLNYRPRSEFELKEKLRQRGFERDSIEAVLDKLKEQGFIDDKAFAQFWKENRESFSPRSQWLTKLELRQKGLTNDIIEQEVDGIDDKESAYRAALSKARILPQTDQQGFQRRLAGFLRRRGFSYSVIGTTVERIWQERGK